MNSADFQLESSNEESKKSYLYPCPLKFGRGPKEAVVSQRYRVGVFGEWSAGKSTLINSLSGFDVFSVATNPETHRIQVIGHAGAHSRPRRAWECEDTEYVFVDGRSMLFKFGLELWDTPGANVEDSRHEELAEIAIQYVDDGLFLMRARDGVTRSVEKRYREVCEYLTSKGLPRPKVVLTRFDELLSDICNEDLEEEVQEVLEEFQTRLKLEEVPWCLDCRNLNSLDGKKLKAWFKDRVVEHAKKHFFMELTCESHGLRLAIIQGAKWRKLVPKSLVQNENETYLDDFVRLAKKSKASRRWAYLKAYWSFPIFNMKRAVERFRAELVQMLTWKDSVCRTWWRRE